MDVLLKCFFENFEATDRISLHAKYKRKAMVEYINTLIKSCRSRDDYNEQNTVREAIVCILRYHDQCRTKNSGVCMMGKYHNVLYVALKLCYDWQLKDTETVAALLDEIYACEHTFERLFIGALFGNNAPHFIAGWKSDFASQEENLRAMIFFLDHATNAACEYEYGDKKEKVRLIDIPIECCEKMTPLKVAIQLGLPDKVHILLKFGASVFSEHCQEKEETVIECILNKLMEFKRNYPYNLVSCLQMLLRAVPSIKVVEGLKIPPAITHMDVLIVLYPQLLQDCILPINRTGVQPVELKHLARCAVRRQLWLNCQLPIGIKSLPIPDELQRYIDLLED